jgi:hypothetical protein
MEIGGFDGGPASAEFSPHWLKQEFTQYKDDLDTLSVDIKFDEVHLTDIEADETVLETAVASVKSNVLRGSLQAILNDFTNEHNISEKRTNLMNKYRNKQDRVNAIKELLSIVPECVQTCSICIERPVTLFLATCCHTFCTECMAKNRSGRCPMCRTCYAHADIKTLIYS